MTGRRIAACTAGLVMACLAITSPALAQEDTYNGSQMWLHYVPVSDAARLARYRAAASNVVVENASQNKVYRNTAKLRWRPGRPRNSWTRASRRRATS